MSKKNNLRKRSMPLLVAVGVIAAVALVFSLVNSSPSTDERQDQTFPVLTLTDMNFDETLSQGLVLVDFWATWCPPCRIQGPIIDELSLAVEGQAVVGKLDVDDYGSIAARYHVSSIPTLILFKDGEPVLRYVGVQQKETLLEAIRAHV